MGLDRGLRPANIVGALTHGLGVPARFIGRVTIVDRKTFIAMPEELARQIAADRPRLWLKGDEVPVFLARPRGEAPPAPRGPPPRFPRR